MTSVYGGIRWGSGICRQMQYEHGQSRIGTTLWNKGGLDLYLENSPLFKADQVTTPLLIMHNDNDGAVPWYQSIEFELKKNIPSYFFLNPIFFVTFAAKYNMTHS